MSSIEYKNKPRPVLTAFIGFLVYLLGGLPTLVFALPQDGTVVGGSVDIQQVSPQQLDIIQSTDKAIIDWNTFSIALDESTNFLMPSSNSINLSRVTGGVGSEIFGTLTSNGILFLVNPSGILFGESATVDVSGLLATTSDIANEDFMAGQFDFHISPPTGAMVINRGQITIKESGLAAFVA
ncbi:MAG: filamentous hemagglutinin N-terminal domain-containing protein, partial [Nitrospinae bacterium]|nr:filamentous hemagglutinin N-terminal domain-containing protein [Nitrospinota bacterium]